MGEQKVVDVYSDRVRKKPYYHLFTQIKRRCKNDNKKCILSFSEFLSFTKIKKCHYCLRDIKWWKHNSDGGQRQYNLDRMDNDKGYSKENCVVCCPSCNQMKNSMSYDEFYRFTQPIRELIC